MLGTRQFSWWYAWDALQHDVPHCRHPVREEQCADASKVGFQIKLALGVDVVVLLALAAGGLAPQKSQTFLFPRRCRF